MSERRINKIHGTLIEDDRVPELLGKIKDLEGKELSIATADKLGGIKANSKTDEYTSEIMIDPETGFLYSKDIPSALVYKGSVDTYAELPEDAKIGDMYNVVQEYKDPDTKKIYPAGTNFGWTGTAWDALGGSIDVSNFATTAQLNAHKNNTYNPHNVTKSQVGLGNVDNTSDRNKPVSTAQQRALNLKQNIINADNKLSYQYLSNTPDIPDETIYATNDEIDALFN